MQGIRTLYVVLLTLTIAGCGGDAPAPEPGPGAAMNAGSAAASPPVEGTSFRGTPLYRNPVDPERLASIESEIETLESRSPKSEDDYIALGMRYIEANRFSDSIDLYSRGLEDFPDSFRLRRHRGHRYINLRQLDRAIVDLEEAVGLIGDEHGDVLEYNAGGEPSATYEHWVWYHIGLYNYLNENWEEAAAAYQKCYDTAISNGNRVGATDWLYNALMKGGMDAEAQAALDRIPVDIDTNREHPYFKRVMVYKGEYLPSDVLMIDKPAGNWTGGDITVGYGVGNWYRFQGNDAMADEIHEKILETPYWNAWAWVVTDREASRRL